MTKPIEGVSEKILACAKEEFLEKGYSEASLRTIAAKADTTTGSIYSRFRDKEGLFGAIVEPAAEGLTRIFLKTQEEFHAREVALAFSARDTETWGNARFIANQLERIYIQHATRCVKQPPKNHNDLLLITPEDIVPIEMPRRKNRIGFSV